jgi:hypothetical protein
VTGVTVVDQGRRVTGEEDCVAVSFLYKGIMMKGLEESISEDTEYCAPDKTPFEWQGWVIHGHKHNNQMQYYPFINGERKTINVSVELIGYKPISMDRLMSLELDSIRSMPMIESQPERW